MTLNPAISTNPAIAPVRSVDQDQPYFDPVAYGNGPGDSVTDTSENAAVRRGGGFMDDRCAPPRSCSRS